MSRVSIRIGGKTFTAATLADSPTAEAYTEQLPQTIRMNNLHANEKYYRFSDDFPSDHKSVSSIEAGDIMLYCAHTVVLFYKSFRTSYAYTRIGNIDNPPGLAEVLVGNDAEVSFSSSW